MKTVAACKALDYGYMRTQNYSLSEIKQKLGVTRDIGPVVIINHLYIKKKQLGKKSL